MANTSCCCQSAGGRGTDRYVGEGGQTLHREGDILKNPKEWVGAVGIFR